MEIPETITSPANPRVKQAAALRSAGDRRRTGLTLVDGLREIARAAAAGVEIVELFVAADVPPDAPQAAARAACLAACANRGGAVVQLGARAFAKLAFGDRDEGVVVSSALRPGRSATSCSPLAVRCSWPRGSRSPGTSGRSCAPSMRPASPA
ncbi:MAG: hypothetical protein ACKO1M_07860 [Planctomycetota bacterium]